MTAVWFLVLIINGGAMATGPYLTADCRARMDAIPLGPNNAPTAFCIAKDQVDAFRADPQLRAPGMNRWRPVKLTASSRRLLGRFADHLVLVAHNGAPATARAKANWLYALLADLKARPVC